MNSELFDDLVESTLLAGGKSKKKDGNLGDSARGQADPGNLEIWKFGNWEIWKF